MFQVCSWCQSYLGEKEPLAYEATTHTICPVCLSKQTNDLRIELWKTLKTCPDFLLEYVYGHIINLTKGENR